MNIRKPVDYRAMYQSLDQIMAAELPQVKLYFEIGRAVSTRPEKGAAVMAAEYLQENYPAFKGFSPRNLRRMRKFYRAYADCEELRGLALGLGWTQNVVILEADLTAVERAWYLSASERNGWSKGELQKRISASAHSEMFLDRDGAICYTEHEESIQECKERYDQDTFYLPWEDQYLTPAALAIPILFKPKRFNLRRIYARKQQYGALREKPQVGRCAGLTWGLIVLCVNHICFYLWWEKKV